MDTFTILKDKKFKPWKNGNNRISNEKIKSRMKNENSIMNKTENTELPILKSKMTADKSWK